MFTAHINKENKIQSCTEHCTKTAELCSEYLSSVGLKKTAYSVGILHDCGKFTDEFDDYIKRASSGEKAIRGEVIHSFAGVSLALNKYHNAQSNNKYELLASELIASAVGSHHGLFDCISADGKSGFDHRLEKQPEYDNRAIKNFFSECCGEAETDELFAESAKEVEAVAQKIIDISKDNDEFMFYISLLSRLLSSAAVDADRSDTAEFMNGLDASQKQADWSECIKNFDRYTASFPSDTPINIARGEISDLCFAAGDLPSGIYRLNVPTGGGKTLSGLRFALEHSKVHNKKRIILVSPLLSILDQNAKEVRKAINNDDIILEHHSNIIREKAHGDESDEDDRYNYLTESWNSPVIITTLVQLLNTMFSGKMSAVRRFHALADSVIVIDEVQTVPANMLSIFNSAVNFLQAVCGATVVMCSATQPTLEKVPHPLCGEIKDIVPKDIIATHSAVFKRTEIVDKGYLTEQEIADFVFALFETNKSTLVICNKKDEAQNLFNIIQSDNYKCFHLSAGMCQKHREDTLENLKAVLYNGDKVICISTQVIEAGVDISFDTVVRYAAGLDNIVQSAGRCNRHGEKARPAKVYIVNCKAEKLTHLESINKAKTACESLLYFYSASPDEYDFDLSGEKSISRYYQNLYSDLPQHYMDYRLGDGLPTMFELMSFNKSALDLSHDYVKKYIIANSLKTAGKSFKVFDDNQDSVVVPYGDAGDMIQILKVNYYRGYFLADCREDIQELKPYTVSVQNYQYKNYCSQNAITELFDGKLLILDKSFYDNQVGILSNEKEDEEKCNFQIL